MPSKTELLGDDELIEITAGGTRRIHPPTKHRLNPVLRPEHWWEGNHIMPLATLYDLEERANIVAPTGTARRNEELRQRLEAFFDHHANPQHDLWKGGRSKAGRLI